MAMNKRMRMSTNSGSSSSEMSGMAAAGMNFPQEAMSIQGIVTQLQALYATVSHNPQAVAYLNTAIFNLGATVGVLSSPRSETSSVSAEA